MCIKVDIAGDGGGFNAQAGLHNPRKLYNFWRIRTSPSSPEHLVGHLQHKGSDEIRDLMSDPI